MRRKAIWGPLLVIEADFNSPIFMSSLEGCLALSMLLPSKIMAFFSDQKHILNVCSTGFLHAFLMNI